MEITRLAKNIKNDFNNTVSLIGVIPLLVFLYIIAGKISNFSVLIGEAGYILLATLAVFATGIIVGKRMLMSVTLRLIEDNQRILSMQQELIEKNRLAAITETVLALGDQINNPLLVISGNLELLNTDVKNIAAAERVHDRIETMRDNFKKIREVTDKMSRLTQPASMPVCGDKKMLDLNKSF